MSVPISYLVVVIVWSTTPLGILWSSETVSPTMAVLLRMLMGTLVGVLLLSVMRIKLPLHRTALKLYSYSVVGVFGGMLLSYLSAQYITSGMISLVFGLAPIISGVLSQKILGTAKLSGFKKSGMALALIGLVIVFYENILVFNAPVYGMAFILSAVFLFSLSGILVKSIKIDIHPAATTVGTLCMSLPLFTLAWWLSDGTLPIAQWSGKSLYAIAYLAIFGSVIGFFAYYYVLQKLTATTVALITMMTPILALALGHFLNNETLSWNLLIGALHVIIGLGLYLFGSRVYRNKPPYLKPTIS